MMVKDDDFIMTMVCRCGVSADEGVSDDILLAIMLAGHLPGEGRVPTEVAH